MLVPPAPPPYVAAILSRAKRSTNVRVRLDRAIVVVMENEESRSLLTRRPANPPAAPFIASLATHYGLAASYYAVAHPSLPNYLALIAGSTFGVADDAPSCFSPSRSRHCHGFDAPTLVDGLDEKHIRWVAFLQSMPFVGYLGSEYAGSQGTYAQKHNPFLYFRAVATNRERRSHIRPLRSMNELTNTLENAATAPRFIYIAPDLCHDMHGARRCPLGTELIREGDRYVRDLVTAILKTPAFTDRSAIFLTWDEGDSDLGCCGVAPGGGHIVTIVIDRKSGHRVSTRPYNHYSLLRTLEDVWGLPPLANASEADPMLDLIP